MRRYLVFLLLTGITLVCELATLRAAVLITPDDPNIQYSGRVDFTDPLQPRFDWPGVSVLARFTGSSIGIKLQDGGNDYNAFIDGALNRVLVTQRGVLEYTVADLSLGPHTLLLTKRTEGYNGVGVFLGLILEDGETLLPPPPQPSRRIEVIGDSISCGYGVEGPGLRCPDLRPYENNYLTYGPMSARTVCAEYHVVAISGKGVVRNYGDPNPTSPDPMPSYYNRTLMNSSALVWDFFQWLPDAVVIFLGTNDFSTQPHPSLEVFVTGYRGLIQTIRTNYPQAQIFCLSFQGANPLAGYVTEVVAREQAEGNKNITYVPLRDLALSELGCDYHPNVAGQQKLADDLIPVLQSVMGWSDCATEAPRGSTHGKVSSPGEPVP